jgi:hypothetical protein
MVEGTLAKEVAQLAAEVRELKAMIAQLGPVRIDLTAEQEFDAVLEQGLDLAEYVRQNG